MAARKKLQAVKGGKATPVRPRPPSDSVILYVVPIAGGDEGSHICLLKDGLVQVSLGVALEVRVPRDCLKSVEE